MASIYCSAGCLFTSSSGYTGVGKPSKSLPFDTSYGGSQGSWLGIATSAVASNGGTACVSGGGVNAVTGSLVTITGLTGTYGVTTGTRVASQTSSCGQWVLADATPSTTPTLVPMAKPSFVPSEIPSLPPTLNPTISSNLPSNKPTTFPVAVPTSSPSIHSSISPSMSPSKLPTASAPVIQVQ